jgi:hypothetical protein
MDNTGVCDQRDEQTWRTYVDSFDGFFVGRVRDVEVVDTPPIRQPISGEPDALVSDCSERLVPAIRVTFDNVTVLAGNTVSKDPVSIQVSMFTMVHQWGMLPLIEDGVIWEWSGQRGLYPGVEIGMGVNHIEGIDSPLDCPLVSTGEDGFAHFQLRFCEDTPPTDGLVLAKLSQTVTRESIGDPIVTARACGAHLQPEHLRDLRLETVMPVCVQDLSDWVPEADQ